MRILKEQILRRTKAFNMQQLIDFVCNDLDMYYERRCVAVANTRQPNFADSRYCLIDTVAPELISQVGIPSDLQFDVRSSTNNSVVYRVDMSVGLCTCHQGNTGGPCKHQAGIAKNFSLSSWKFIPDPRGDAGGGYLSV